MQIKSLHVLILTVAFAGSAMAASDRGDWNAVVELKPGAQVEVVHAALQKTVGRLTAVDGDGISVQTESGLRLVDRRDVRRVSVKAGSRKRRALIGALVGAAAGTAFAAIGGAGDKFEVRTGIVMAATIPAGAGIGAVLGGATGGTRTVYRTSE